MNNSIMKKRYDLKKNKKGFTLVEVIVVLVILAILAAILVPTLIGYIDKANDKAVVAEARSAFMAAQTLASESYGETGTAAASEADIKDLSGVKGTITLSFANNKIDSFVYASGGKTATWDFTNDKWTVT